MLGWPGGTVLVAIAGVVVVGVGVFQAYKGLAKKFLEEAKTDEMDPGVRKGYTALGVFGYVARAIVFVMVGYGLIRAALEYDPKKAVGLDGALHELADSSYGPALLWVATPGRGQVHERAIEPVIGGTIAPASSGRQAADGRPRRPGPPTSRETTALLFPSPAPACFPSAPVTRPAGRP